MREYLPIECMKLYISTRDLTTTHINPFHGSRVLRLDPLRGDLANDWPVASICLASKAKCMICSAGDRRHVCEKLIVVKLATNCLSAGGTRAELEVVDIIYI